MRSPASARELGVVEGLRLSRCASAATSAGASVRATAPLARSPSASGADRDAHQPQHADVAARPAGGGSAGCGLRRARSPAMRCVRPRAAASRTSRAAFRHRRRRRALSAASIAVVGNRIDLHVVASCPGPVAGSVMRAAHAGIVGEQQQPFAGLVEPADGREPRQARAVEAAIDRVAPALVARGRHQAARLVEHDDAAFGRVVDRTAVERDAMAAGDRRELGIAHDASIDAARALRGSTRPLACANTRRAWTARARVRARCRGLGQR